MPPSEKRSLRLEKILIICLVLSSFCQQSIADQDEQGEVWYRDFPEQQEAIDVTIESVGANFRCLSPDLGILRSETPKPFTAGNSACAVSWNVVPAPDGYDIVYTISNPTLENQAPPTLRIDGQMLEDHIEFLNHQFGCSFNDLDASNNQAISSPGKLYPRSLYAPLVLVRDSRFAVGFALHYPVLEYKHNVKTRFHRQAGADAWTVRFTLETELLPDEVRYYRISARYAYPEDWIHTVKTYRDYFWSLYGNTPAYQQDMRPVYKVQVSHKGNLSQDNPRGFRINSRPDLYGWQTEINSILVEMKESGFERAMVWKPSGVYLNNHHSNFPPQIMSSWTEPMINSAGEWHRFEQEGLQLLYWWGHSTHYADQWDDPSLEEFDIFNQVQNQAMMNEWQLAVTRYASGCGLDTFKRLPLWDALMWMDQLQTVKPNAVLVTEPVSSDIMHMRFPTFVQSKNLPDPHILADYLVPGREMWLHLRDEGNREQQPIAERALEGISWGMTIVLKQGTISAFDLNDAIEEAMASNGNRPHNTVRDEYANSQAPEDIVRKSLIQHPNAD